MSLALIELRYLNKKSSDRSGADGATSAFDRRPSVTSVTPTFNLPALLSIAMVAAILIIMATASAIYWWSGLMYVAIGVALFVLLPFTIARIVVMARRKQNLKRKNEAIIQNTLSKYGGSIANANVNTWCVNKDIRRVKEMQKMKKNSINEMKIFPATPRDSESSISRELMTEAKDGASIV